MRIFYNYDKIISYFLFSVFIAPVIIASVLIAILATFLEVKNPSIGGLSVMILGCLLILTAKIKVLKNGSFLTFGQSALQKMKAIFKLSYIFGYLFLIAGYFLVIHNYA